MAVCMCMPVCAYVLYELFPINQSDREQKHIDDPVPFHLSFVCLCINMFADVFVNVCLLLQWGVSVLLLGKCPPSLNMVKIVSPLRSQHMAPEASVLSAPVAPYFNIS